MSRRLSLWLVLSLGLHAGLAALTLVLVGLSPRPLPLLFVDLVQGFLGAPEPVRGGAGARGDGTPPGESRGVAPGRPATPGTRPVAQPAPSPERRPPPERMQPPELLLLAPPPRGLALQEPSRMTPQPAPEEPARSVPEPPAPVTTPRRVVEGAPPSALPGGHSDGTSRGVSEGGVAAGDPSATGGGSLGARGAGSSAGSGGRAAAGGGQGLGLGAREGSVLALAIPGDGTGIEGEYQGYAALVHRRVQGALQYPPAARRRGLVGTVGLKVIVDTTGKILEVALAESSSHRLLDEAAIEAARAVERVPFPPDVRPKPLGVPVKVQFDFRIETR